MADLTNKDTLQEAPNGQADGASGKSQTDSQGSDTVRKADLVALQSKLDKRIAAERAEKLALQQQLAALQSQNRQVLTRGMDEDELRAFNLAERERIINEQWAAIQATQQEQARLQLFQRISKVHGIPVETLEEEAENPDHAWELGATYARTKEEERTEEKVRKGVEKKTSAADVDLGSGSSVETDDEYTSLYKSGDGMGYILKRLKQLQDK